MTSNHDPVLRLIHEFSKLPGVGEKSATRIAYHVLRNDSAQAESLCQAVMHAKRNIVLCRHCLTFTDQNLCHLCSDPSRQKSLICVVEKPVDILAIESSGKFRGLYHVLHGLLSPLDGIGPEQIHVKELSQRLRENSVEEIILALNSSVEAEATSIFLSRLLASSSKKITKLAAGIPVGGVLEYTDRLTLGRALENRVAL